MDAEKVEITDKITKSALQRILKRCGVRLIGNVFSLLRIIIKDFSTIIVGKMFVFMDISKRRTFQIEDLKSENLKTEMKNFKEYINKLQGEKV